MKNLLALRKKLKLSQSAFWARVGITQSGGSRYENGHALPKPMQMLVTIAYGPEREAAKVATKLRTAA